MQADCFGTDIDIVAINRLNFAFAQHAQDPLRRLNRICQQRIRSTSRNKRTVRLIISIREHFTDDAQLRGLGHAL